MKSLLGIIFLFTGILSFGQMNSQVHLKNGSAIRGEITKNDSTGVTIRTRDGSYWNFNPEEISSIDKYSAEVSPKGFYNRTSLGVMGGSQIGGSLRVVNGYAFNRHWEAGFGLGIENFTWVPYVPIFFEGRYNFLKGSTRPFISTHAGYELPLRNLEFNKGGLTTGAELGVTHYFQNKIGISTAIGYHFAYLREDSWWWDDFTTIQEIHRFEIRLGLVFR